ncbi:MAG: TldD/PmbA family protein [Bacillota bacterium]
MIGRDEAQRLLAKALSFSKAEETQVNLRGETLHLTRWNNNHIHQNLVRRNAVLTVRAVVGKRVGTASTNLLDDRSLRETVELAGRHAARQKPNPELAPLPGPEPIPEVATFVRRTAESTPEERADAAGVIITAAQKKGLTAAGTYSAEVEEVAVANSRGVSAYNSGTTGFIRTIVSDGDNTGYADRMARDTGEFSPSGLAAEAILKATLRREAADLPTGGWDTIFEEYAVADLIRFFGYIAFGALAVQEGRSFMAKVMGEKALGENVTIWDDGLDRRGLAEPFDVEGVPKKKVVIIDRGVARGVVHNTMTAAREGKPSTGHAAVSDWGDMGPMPSNMIMATGTSTKDEMIRRTKKGVLVTRFHYTHSPEPMRVVATGTTRDGTFLIENGEITTRLRNLRYTQSLIEAFNRVEAIAATARITRDWWSTFTSVLPAIKIGGFNFTGGTTF